MAKAKSRAEKIKALEEKRAKAKAEIKRIEEELRPLLIEEYEAKTGLKPGVLVTQAGRDNAGRVFRIKEFTVTLYGVVKPKAEMILKGGKVWPSLFTLYNECRVLDEEEALKIIRETPEDND